MGETMKPKNMKQTQIHADDGGGILVIGLAMALLFLVVSGFLWAISMSEPLPGTKTITYEGIPGCMLSDKATHFPETITVDNKTWTTLSYKQYQQIGFLDGKAEWMTRPMLVCDGKEKLFWYWREKK